MRALGIPSVPKNYLCKTATFKTGGGLKLSFFSTLVTPPSQKFIVIEP